MRTYKRRLCARTLNGGQPVFTVIFFPAADANGGLRAHPVHSNGFHGARPEGTAAPAHRGRDGAAHGHVSLAVGGRGARWAHRWILQTRQQRQGVVLEPER